MSQKFSKTKPQKHKGQKSLLGSSELIRKLQHLLDKEIPQTQSRFSERLTQNMDFSSSLKLSELQGHLRVLDRTKQVKAKAQTLEDQKKSLNAAFERVHRAILQSIEQSFDESVVQPRFPLPKINLENDKLDLSAYQVFYMAQQTEMSAKIQGLRTYVREVLSSASLNMTKLALLDQTLEETIGFPLRSGFSVISKIISKHCYKIEEQWQKHDHQEVRGQLNQFHSELRQLLLAELELRLQAIQGLVDAFNQEV